MLIDVRSAAAGQRWSLVAAAGLGAGWPPAPACAWIHTVSNSEVLGATITQNKHRSKDNLSPKEYIKLRIFHILFK